MSEYNNPLDSSFTEPNYSNEPFLDDNSSQKMEEETKFEGPKPEHKYYSSLNPVELETFLEKEEKLDQETKEQLKSDYIAFYSSLNNCDFEELDQVLNRMWTLAGRQSAAGSTMIRMGIIPAVFSILDHKMSDYKQIQKEALDLISNLLIEPEDTAYLVEQGCIPILMRYLQINNDKNENEDEDEDEDEDNNEIQDNVVGCLANIAGEADSKYRTKIINQGVLNYVCKKFENIRARSPNVGHSAWLVSNLLQQPLIVPIEDVLSVLSKFLIKCLYHKNQDVYKETLASVSSVSQSKDERVMEIITSPSVIINIFNQIKRIDEVSMASLEFLANLKMSYITAAKKYMKNNALGPLKDFLNDKNETIKSKVCHVLSALLVGGFPDPQSIITHEILPRVIELSCEGDSETREKAIDCLLSFIQSSIPNELQYLISQGLIGALLINLANHNEVILIKKALEAISGILNLGKQASQNETNHYATLMMQSDLWSLVNGLSNHQDMDIINSVADIRKRFF